MEIQAAPITGDPEKDRIAGLEVYAQCTRAFVEVFDSSEPQAYMALLQHWMTYGPLFISGQLISQKEHLDKLQDLQSHIKKGGTGGRSMTDLFSDWFNEETA